MNDGTVAVGFLDPGEWSACFGMSLVDLYLVDAHTFNRMIPNGKQLRTFCPAHSVVDGRNKIAARFLDDTECEWLFMVDTDMGFGPATVEQLVASADPAERPVMGALCFGLKREGAAPFYADVCDIFPTIYDWYEDDTKAGFVSRVDYEHDTIVPAAGTGAACIVIHRSTLEAVRAKYGDHWFDRITHPTGPTTFSEDLSFCIRLNWLGIPLFVDTGVKTTHHKGGIFLDDITYERQQIAVAAEAAALAGSET